MTGRRLVQVLVVAILLVPSPSAVAATSIQRHHHDRGGEGYDQGRDDDGGYSYRRDRSGDDYGNGDNGPRQGNGNKQGRCRGDGCRGSFSPGPFDRSPVTIIICPPGTQQCGTGGGQGQQPPPQDQQPQSVACLVPVPFHCDPKPEDQ